MFIESLIIGALFRVRKLLLKRISVNKFKVKVVFCNSLTDERKVKT